ncbi:helix-turn-helix domain-containing protein [Microtetraspora glauca]|uniref:Helix-turn-helix transcriptional regulator n=1 Tax=Microtetraspora glauca TaxID=1996 RepID=A0ABV3GHG3_MICGL
MSQSRLCPVCRKTLLSRYSQEAMCGACLRGAPAPAWDLDALTRALAARDLAAFATTVRKSMKMSQLEFANLVGWAQSTVARVERGERDTLYDVRELVRFADAVGLPRTALLPLFTEETDDMDLTRRELAGLVASGVMAGLAWSIPARVGAEQIGLLRESIDRLYGQDQQVGGSALIRTALFQLSRVRALLDDAEFSESIGRQLLSVAGELCVCAGWLAYDSDDQRLARQLYGEAHLYAAHADDPVLLVHVASNSALQAVRLAREEPGRAREALRFVAAAEASARRWATPRVHALLALREAYAHSMLKDELAYRSAITRAWRELERGTHEDDPPWVGFVDAAELTGNEGMAAVNLGQAGRAVQRFAEVVAEPWLGHRNRTYYRARLAMAHLSGGDEAEAFTQGTQALSTRIRSRRILRELTPLRGLAERSRDQHAEQFRASYDTAGAA